MNELVSNDYLECLLKSLSIQSEGISSQGAPANDQLSWLKQLRKQAIDRAGQLRLPTTKDEAWRFTDLSPLAKLPFKPAKALHTLALSDIQSFFIEETDNRLVFVDGFFAPEFSSISDKEQLIIDNLPSLAESHASLAASHLAQHAQYHENIFAALNTAFVHDGAVIIVPKNVVAAAPVHLLFIATQKETTNYPRCLIIGEANSQVTLIEDYVSLQNDAYVTNSVTECYLAANARAQHIRIQRENNDAYHLANCAVSLEHASHYHAVNVSFGAQISRYNLDVGFKAEAGECAIDGLTIITDEQLADTHSCIDHIKPNCTSRQQHKCIADGAAHAVFNGNIIVRPGAQRTDSSQSSRNLLLSGTAQIDTKPQLEIFADDVKCAHGATVGQLDNEEIFYLKSRGLSESAARNLLTYAFGAEILGRIPLASLRHTLEQTVLNQTQSSR
ncbi:Fe-S cluster assembly protein SufD [Nitrosomonas sp.]|uniref:Fe-S cluster assembly protein SufD n=1 Tax=Nitrosomonas sp. TaxID=42353 RepID=UPI00208B5261|nr:Fe-S cluster assembly protein SufD [Nitrosomonas sp.]GJL76851.1 MAG: Fe-S cluster assembly protein SufD [Nitrosomonas sp.]